MALYHFFGDNLGWAIIFIAVITRLVLIPFMKKQTEMTRKMSGLKPQLEELKKKYENNPKKLSEEQMKLYKKVGYNPLGCLATFIPQLVVLSVLISVIRNVTSNTLEGVYPFIQNWLGITADFHINTTFLGLWDLTKAYKFSDFISGVGSLTPEALKYLALYLLVGISQYLATKFTQILQNPLEPSAEETKKKKDGEVSPEAMQKKMMGSMNLILPFSTIFIAISAPSALSLYWVIQSVMLIAQYFILDWDKTKKGVQNLFTRFKKKRK